MTAGRLALGLCLGLASLSLAAGTREDLQRLEQQLQAMEARMARTESGLASLQKGLQELSARLDGVARSAQTADLRADFDQLKRQVEALSAQLASLRGEAGPASSPAPPAFTPAYAPPLAPDRPAPPPERPAAKPPAASGVTPDLYNQAHADYVQGKYDLAALEFQQYLEAYPQDARAGNSQYWIGECHYSQKRYLEAKDAFETVIRDYPAGNKVLAARLKLGLTHLALGETGQGIAVLKALVQAAPDSDEALIARDRLSRLQAP